MVPVHVISAQHYYFRVLDNMPLGGFHKIPKHSRIVKNPAKCPVSYIFISRVFLDLSRSLKLSSKLISQILDKEPKSNLSPHGNTKATLLTQLPGKMKLTGSYIPLVLWLEPMWHFTACQWNCGFTFQPKVSKAGSSPLAGLQFNSVRSMPSTDAMFSIPLHKRLHTATDQDWS